MINIQFNHLYVLAYRCTKTKGGGWGSGGENFCLHQRYNFCSGSERVTMTIFYL